MSLRSRSQFARCQQGPVELCPHGDGQQGQAAEGAQCLTVWPTAPSGASMVILGKSLHHGPSVSKVVKEDAVGAVLHSLTLWPVLDI